MMVDVMKPTVTPAPPSKRSASVLDKAEQSFLAGIVFWSFACRAALAVLLEWTDFSTRLAPDETTYEFSGRSLALYWAGEIFIKPMRFTQEQPLGYYYLNALGYYLFGQTEVPIKLANAFVGAFCCRYVYQLARDLFGASVAKRATRFYAFFPSLVLWSALNIRDVWVVFLILFVSWKSHQVLQGYSHTGLVGILAGLYGVTHFRDYLFYVVALPPLLAVLIGRRGNLGRNVLLAFLVGVGVLALVESGAGRGAEEHMSLEALSEARRNLATGGSAFAEEVDISTPGKAIGFLPLGLAYFLFSPFPWQITSTLKMLSLPEMLLIYLYTGAALRGFRYILTQRLRECLQIVVLTGLLTVSYALGEGNVGTLYRHRAQVMVFFLMFAAVGVELRSKHVAKPLAA